MQRWKRQITLQSWATLSLMAMLAVFSSPAFAFACCCHSAPPGVSHSVEHDAVGCCEEEGHSAVESGKHSHAEAVSQGVSHFSDVCHCANSNITVVAFVDSQNSSSFPPLVTGPTSARFVLSVASDERIAVFFASHALRPRPPSGATRSGRAPPAFSL